MRTRKKIKSAAAYEVFGIYDLLLRVWLPPDQGKLSRAARFQDALVTELAPHGLKICEGFNVEYPIEHWAFARKGGMHNPADADVQRLLSDVDLVERAERGNLDAVERVDLTTRQRLLALPEFKDPSHPGIKFGLIVTTDEELSQNDRKDFEKLVITIVQSATNMRERSLYAGHGFGDFIILGRVDYRKFHELENELVTPLNAAPLREPYGAITTTLVCGSPGYLLCTESLIRSAFASDTLDGELWTKPTESELEVGNGELIASRFEVLDYLGDGAFGTVYKVRDRVEGVERALKLFGRLGHEAAWRELSTLRRIKRPNVVEMYWSDREPESGRWYLISEFVGGQPLASLLNRAGAQLSDAEAVEIVRQVLIALEGIHPNVAEIEEIKQIARERELSSSEFARLQRLEDEGVIHRDIKPENIMVTPEGIVKLIDFGIASAAGAPVKTVSATPRYQLPKYAVSSEGEWGPDADLYAVGVVLYEMLCDGQHPYENKATDMIPPERVRAGLAAPLAAWLVRACAITGGTGSFGTAEEMRTALEEAWAASIVGSEVLPDP